jgi:hypothetical protein
MIFLLGFYITNDHIKIQPAIKKMGFLKYPLGFLWQTGSPEDNNINQLKLQVTQNVLEANYYSCSFKYFDSNDH